MFKLTRRLCDHIADIDPDAKPYPALLGHVWFALGHSTLDLDSTTNRTDDARELGQEAVAGVLYDPAPVLADLRIDQFWEVGLEALVRPLLISSHQARIARHIGGKDRCEARGHVLPGGKVPLFSLPQNRRCPYGACANPLTS